MKILTNRNFKQKIIISIVCILLLNFCMASNVKAETEILFGGKIMGLIRSFLTAVADVTISVIQLGMTGHWSYAVDQENTGQRSDWR